MSVKDMIKKSVLESEMYNQAISAGTILTILIDLAVAILCGMLIYFIYKKSFLTRFFIYSHMVSYKRF